MVQLYMQHLSMNTDVVTCGISKSRVVPLVLVTIPRLELMAALLARRLTLTLLRVLSKSTTDATFYSDSMDILWWIDDMKKTFGCLWRIESVKLGCTVILFSDNMYQAHRILLI